MRDLKEWRGKTQNRLILRGNIQSPGDTPNIFLSGCTDVFLLSNSCRTRFDPLPLFVLMCDGLPLWVVFQKLTVVMM